MNNKVYKYECIAENGVSHLCLCRENGSIHKIMGARFGGIDERGRVTESKTYREGRVTVRRSIEVTNLRRVGDQCICEMAPVEHKFDDEIMKIKTRLEILSKRIIIANSSSYADSDIIFGILSNKEIILLIPDEITYIRSLYDVHSKDFIGRVWEELLRQCSDFTLRVIGGHGLLVASSMFEGLDFNTLDLSRFDMSRVVKADSMFRNLTLKKLIPCEEKVESLVDAGYMFHSIRVPEIDLRNICANSIQNLSSMFQNAEIPNGLNVSNWELDRLEIADKMFAGGNFGECLDLSKWKLPICEEYGMPLVNIIDMFARIESKVLVTDPNLRSLL